MASVATFSANTGDKVCQCLATGQWFSPGTLVSSTNKTDHHYLTEILLNVVLNTINNVLLEVRFIMYSLALLNIIYSYKYLESDLIKYLSRDIYPFVGSTAREEIPT